ncbi:flagellar filament capping protein FliD [Aliarcobacter cryaerophilus]|uniref:flagellar filament capping protein FliD n=1 Tax=Aliarcobacter cryaerophilus TaxID=28198 RepID=UPI0021B4A0A9|nr:flagellar filament capping protein FliD [Aliarcobacter cryaerophilus]MCT7470002.1 flagellar filament capping protein FliD [Aliarcobacter cryaerophilus]MCT7498263.1 flagellar filament capping protein FliD [Aliarcobacter cryaerophilus]MCT7504795.1 flagellar filament capping protein FliD [Aliarcobacter cryaerophilus]MCT7511504.1 flagellar filament capping protein FliD [Aliarcobacter cryaerophilus]MCT7542633.1 flagellar filament capping protein FliD [Aliarcobacter cryaerophilus]
MATGILGLGQGQAASLNSDMLEKLKAVDRKATVEPIEKKLEKFESEKKVISDVTTKVNELFDAVKVFSLNQSTGTNAFQQKSANVSGDGVVFDSDDLNALKTGSLRVEVKELAQKDVWQSKPIVDADGKAISKDSKVDKGILDIKLGGGTSIPINTTGKTYSELVTEINKIDGVQASLVEDSTGKFRLSIKSSETGSANKITIDGAASTHFGFANVLSAQDMQLKADGVDYSSSSNTVTIDGLKITATKKGGDSTINIENDTTTLSAQMKNFADKFNELRATIENEIYSADASVDNKGALRDMLATVKNELFGTGSGKQSIFDFGFSLDEKSGDIIFNKKDFEASIKNGTADLEALFAGTADKKGIATSMDELISTNGVTKSLLDYEINMLEREERLKKDKETAETTLDNKYSLMAQQFASYGVMINQMESSFSGLKMLILQSQASR